LKRIKMEVIPRPDAGSASVFVIQVPPAFYKINPYAGFDGSNLNGVDYLCGACGVVIAESMSRGSISGMVLKCSKCKSYNSVRGS